MINTYVINTFFFGRIQTSPLKLALGESKPRPGEEHAPKSQATPPGQFKWVHML